MEEMVTKNRTLNWWYVGGIILIICVIGSLFYVKNVSTNNQNKADSTTATPTPTATPTAVPTPTPVQSVELDITSPEVTGLLATFDNASFPGDFTGYFIDRKFEAKDFDPTFVFHVATTAIGNQVSSFTKAQLDDKIHAILGSNYQFNGHKTYTDGCKTWNYDSNTEIYTYTETTGCGGTGIANSRKIVKAVRTGLVTEVYVRVLYIGELNMQGGADYYKDYRKTIKLDGIEFNDIVEERDIAFNRGSLYKMTFMNENGNNVFVSSELAE